MTVGFLGGTFAVLIAFTVRAIYLDWKRKQARKHIEHKRAL